MSGQFCLSSPTGKESTPKELPDQFSHNGREHGVSIGNVWAYSKENTLNGKQASGLLHGLD